MAGIGCRGLLGIDEDRPLLPVDVVDAGDAGEMVDAAEAGPGFCESLEPKPAFCADFDQGSVTKGWENEGKIPDPGEFGGGKIALDPELGNSPPASAVFTLPALVTAAQNSAAFLLHKMTKVPTAVRVDFDVFVGTEFYPKGTGGNVIIASLHFIPNCSVEVVRDSVGTALAIYVGAAGTRVSVTALTEPFPVGAWKRVTIFVHADEDAGAPAGNGIALVSIDNINAATAPIPTPFRAGATQLNLTLGAVYGDGPINKYRANLDNVRIYTIE